MKEKYCKLCSKRIHPSVRVLLCKKHRKEFVLERKNLLEKVQKEYMKIHQETLQKDWEAFKIDHLFYYRFKDKRGRFIKEFRYS